MTALGYGILRALRIIGNQLAPFVNEKIGNHPVWDELSKYVETRANRKNRILVKLVFIILFVIIMTILLLLMSSIARI